MKRNFKMFQQCKRFLFCSDARVRQERVETCAHNDYSAGFKVHSRIIGGDWPLVPTRVRPVLYRAQYRNSRQGTHVNRRNCRNSGLQ